MVAGTLVIRRVMVLSVLYMLSLIFVYNLFIYALYILFFTCIQIGSQNDYLFLKCSNLTVHLIKTSQATISMGRDLLCHKHGAYETDNQELEIKVEKKVPCKFQCLKRRVGKAKRNNSSVFLKDAFSTTKVEAMVSAQSFINYIFVTWKFVNHLLKILDYSHTFNHQTWLQLKHPSIMFKVLKVFLVFQDIYIFPLPLLELPFCYFQKSQT